MVVVRAPRFPRSRSRGRRNGEWRRKNTGARDVQRAEERGRGRREIKRGSSLSDPNCSWQIGNAPNSFRPILMFVFFNEYLEDRRHFVHFTLRTRLVSSQRHRRRTYRTEPRQEILNAFLRNRSRKRQALTYAVVPLAVLRTPVRARSQPQQAPQSCKLLFIEPYSSPLQSAHAGDRAPDCADEEGQLCLQRQDREREKRGKTEQKKVPNCLLSPE